MTEAQYNAELAGLRSAFQSEFEAQIEERKAEILGNFSGPALWMLRANWWILKRVAVVLAPHLFDWLLSRFSGMTITQILAFFGWYKQDATPAR